MPLQLDHAVGGEAVALKLTTQPLSELRFREQQEVLHSLACHRHRGDHARLRRQQQRLADLADPEALDVVRHHPVQIAGRFGAAHANERPWPLDDL